MEIVREAQGSAESLMVFALEANRRIRDAAHAAALDLRPRRLRLRPRRSFRPPRN